MKAEQFSKQIREAVHNWTLWKLQLIPLSKTKYTDGEKESVRRERGDNKVTSALQLLKFDLPIATPNEISYKETQKAAGKCN